MDSGASQLCHFWCLAGGKDRRSGLILTIPLCLEQTNMDELSVTLDYLLSIPSFEGALASCGGERIALVNNNSIKSQDLLKKKPAVGPRTCSARNHEACCRERQLLLVVCALLIAVAPLVADKVWVHMPQQSQHASSVVEVVNWLEGPGSEQLRAQWGIGDSIRASQALQQKHEEIESQHSEWFAVYVELNQQIAALLNAGDEEDLVELKSLQQQLSDVCYRQASQLEFRQNLLQAALEFHGVAQDLSQQLDGLLGMLCVDVAPADGASIQQTLKLLEEKLKSVDVGLQGLREKGQGLLDQISNQASWAYGKDVTIENKENVDHIQGVMEDMQLRKQRCEDMVDVRRLKMLQMVQLFKCEEDAAQAVEWLSELLDALLKTHTRLGDDAQETKVLLEKHRKFVDVAQSTYDYGRQLLQATVVLCQSLRCTSRSSGDTLPRLNRVWKQFTVASEERVHRLEMAIAFHSNAEKILQDCPEEPEAINDEEQFDEVEAVGKSLLDRLTVPVVYPDGTEQYFGSPSDMASTAEHIRDRMKLVSLKRQQLRHPEMMTTES
ncbi:TPA: hypothetical protein BOS_1640 [Bos taurus]|nr:TPA: hypothetical protein BOS_1640 [Bos taurus]